MKKFVSAALLILFLASHGFASRVTEMSMEALHTKSDLVVIASVTEVKKREYTDLVTIHVGSYLKGQSKERTYFLTLSPRGLTGFDPELKKGDTGIFFLAIDKETGKAKLTHWGGVAIFTKNYLRLDAGK